MATQRKKDLDKAKLYLQKLEIARNSTEVNPFETEEEKELRIQKAKVDPQFFVETYLPHYATAKSASFHLNFANEVAMDPLFKGFAEWGRGLAKSVWCDIIIPLWLWVRGEDIFLCLCSDSKENASLLLDDVQAELEANPLLINDFGAQKSNGTWESGSFQTIDQRFIAMAFGIKQKKRGTRVKHRRPNLWVIDDLETPDTIKNPKRMEEQAKNIEREMIPSMTGKNRRLLYVNNKFARVMTQTLLQERHPEWKVRQVKAYNKVTYKPAWPAMYSADYYRDQESDMGITAAYAEYLHEAKIEGKNFSEDDIRWTKLPDLHEFDMIVSHWDIAYTDNETSDYNAVKVWGVKDRKFYLIDCLVKQCKMRIACNWQCEFKMRIPKGVNLLMQYEGQFWNEEVQRNIEEAEAAYNISLNIMKVNTPRVNKLGRMITMQPYYQNSRIYYNEELKSHSDTQVGIMQLCAVEEGSSEHDDSPDADQQAISTLEHYVVPQRKRGRNKSYKTGKMKHRYDLP